MRIRDVACKPPTRKPMNTPTPRTNAITSQYSQPPETVMVISTFAAQLETELADMTRQRDEWKAKYIQQNKDLGCEQMDPNGTIWEHAVKLQKQVVDLQLALTKAQ